MPDRKLLIKNLRKAMNKNHIKHKYLTDWELTNEIIESKTEELNGRVK